MGDVLVQSISLQTEAMPHQKVENKNKHHGHNAESVSCELCPRIPISIGMGDLMDLPLHMIKYAVVITIINGIARWRFSILTP